MAAPRRSDGRAFRGKSGSKRRPPRSGHGGPSRGGAAATAGRRFEPRSQRNFRLPAPVVEELRGEAGPARADQLEAMLAGASRAYERDRYDEALSLVRAVLREAPGSTAARELLGLTLYRLGRWKQAASELRRLHEATGSVDQYPVIADCERALGRTERVGELWEELRTSDASQEVVAEGRIVMAGVLADSGRLEEAIALLGPAASKARGGGLYKLRQVYALADLYERAGDLPRARQLFGQLATEAPDLFDAPQRLRAIV